VHFLELEKLKYLKFEVKNRCRRVLNDGTGREKDHASVDVVGKNWSFESTFVMIETFQVEEQR